ncbi:hypothetical protein [Achromobacter arsenitoxydans]|uniref:hypothetical protein n=1 Tax=Achromobacter arsenitoxydans TaxID=1147684 RepID=UPI0011129CA1|nr:hypothetical protein [Achromobacter arsenitoxydans]
MSSPEPVLTPTPVGNILVSFASPLAATAGCASSCPPRLSAAANEDLPPAPPRDEPSAAAPPARVPLSAWLSLAFWAIGTALLFTLGLAYRLVA